MSLSHHHQTEHPTSCNFLSHQGIAPVLADTWCTFRRPISLYDKLAIGVRVEGIEAEKGQFLHRYIVWSEDQETVSDLA